VREYFGLFIGQELIRKISDQTDLYISHNELKAFPSARKWHETNCYDIRSL